MISNRLYVGFRMHFFTLFGSVINLTFTLFATVGSVIFTHHSISLSSFRSFYIPFNRSVIIPPFLRTIQYVCHRFHHFCAPFNWSIQLPHVGGLCIDIVSGMTSISTDSVIFTHHSISLSSFRHFCIPFNRSIIGFTVFAYHSIGLYSM